MNVLIRSLSFAGFLTLAIAGSAFAHGTHAVTDISHTTITFDPGSSMLTDTDKASLKNLCQQAEQTIGIDKVAIAAWSDQPLPARGQTLTAEDRRLADARASVISDYLKTYTDVTVTDKYNMAETSNWLARTFKTSDAELKSLFSKRGAMNPVTSDEFYIIKRDGGPSMAVVVLRQKNP